MVHNNNVVFLGLNEEPISFYTAITTVAIPIIIKVLYNNILSDTMSCDNIIIIMLYYFLMVYICMYAEGPTI